MNEKYLQEAQEYLTHMKNGQLELIVGIAYLSENHSLEEIIRFLKDYLRDKEKELKNLFLESKTDPQIDKTVAVMFRVHMAISTLEKGKEVHTIVRCKPRAKKSGRIFKRDRRRHSGSRKWQDKNHDGKNWHPGQRIQRVA